MNLIQAKIFFDRKLKEIKSINEKYILDTKGVYPVDTISKYKDGGFWATGFIIDEAGCSVGKMSFNFSGSFFNINIKHYKPPSYPYEASDDDYFFMLMYYAKTGRKLLECTLGYFKSCADQMQNTDYRSKVAWRESNPKTGKNKRKGLQKKSIRNIMRQLVLNMTLPDYNGWGLSRPL